jgi:hypothetical protein
MFNGAAICEPEPLDSMLLQELSAVLYEWHLLNTVGAGHARDCLIKNGAPQKRRFDLPSS